MFYNKASENSIMCLWVRQLKDFESDWAQPGSMLHIDLRSALFVSLTPLADGQFLMAVSELQENHCEHTVYPSCICHHIYSLPIKASCMGDSIRASRDGGRYVLVKGEQRLVTNNLIYHI